MSDEYAAKMSRKTLPELQLYVQNRADYREGAVLAALDELAQRGHEPAEAAAIRAELRPIVEQQQLEQQREKEEARQAATEPVPAEATGPLLYSPGTIVLFSMLSGSMMLGGGILLAMNLFRLGRKRALLGLIAFIVVYLLVGLQLLNWAVTQGGLSLLLGAMLFNVPALLAYLLWFWPRYVRTEKYRSRSLIPPILICFLIAWGLQKALPYLIKQQPREVQQQMEQLMGKQP